MRRRARPRRPVLWGGRNGDYQIGGPEDRARSLILNGTAAYRKAAAALIREVRPALEQFARDARPIVRALERASADLAADPRYRSTPDRLKELGL